MRRCVLFTLLLNLCAIVSAQEIHTVKVGVAPLQNRVAASVSSLAMRDRLVQALNDLKPDRKSGIKIDAIALDGDTGNDLADQAVQKSCDYIVYTALVDMSSAIDPNMQLPGRVQTNPNLPGTVRTPNTGPEYSATIDYKLYDLARHSAIPGSSLSNRQATDQVHLVSQIMDRIAPGVFSTIRKNPPKQHE